MDDLAADRSESFLTKSLVELMGWNVVSKRVPNAAHLAAACSEFGIVQSNGRDFDIVLISAHGCSQGIGMTDGSLIKWEDLFPLFGESLHEKIVIMSSCSVLKDNFLRDYLEGYEFSPFDLWGFREKVDWPGAAVAVSMLLKTVHSNISLPDSEQHLKTLRTMNTFAAIWQLYGLDIQALRFHSGSSGCLKGRLVEFASMPDPDGCMPMPSSFFGPAQVEAITELSSMGVPWAKFERTHIPKIIDIMGSLDTPITTSLQLQQLNEAFSETYEQLKQEKQIHEENSVG